MYHCWSEQQQQQQSLPFQPILFFPLNNYLCKLMEGGVIFFDPLSMLVFPFFLSFMALPLACSTTKHMVPSMNNACYPTINITKHFDIFYATFFFFTLKIIQRQVKKYLWICQWERVWWWWWWYYNSWGSVCVW